ncbi:MAG: flavoprotein [Candidatus Margulisbacteria bacterium]|nr:flavoprotein [Candidatus Margulisiibacteriota bacterium]
MQQKILIGITGGIAAYKTIELIHLLKKDGHSVKVILTPTGQQFVTTLTIKTMSGYSPYLDNQETIADDIEHIELAKWADLMVVAPATANTLAKLAHGLADNLLTGTILALPQKTPLYIAPAMNTRMWDNKITQTNLKSLKKYYPQIQIIPPRVSTLACEETGMGAMATIEEILAVLRKKLK